MKFGQVEHVLAAATNTFQKGSFYVQVKILCFWFALHFTVSWPLDEQFAVKLVSSIKLRPSTATYQPKVTTSKFSVQRCTPLPCFFCPYHHYLSPSSVSTTLSFISCSTAVILHLFPLPPPIRLSTGWLWPFMPAETSTFLLDALISLSYITVFCLLPLTFSLLCAIWCSLLKSFPSLDFSLHPLPLHSFIPISPPLFNNI